jgi:flagellar hook-length control protein FliK
MAFTLETIFSSRPAREPSESGNRPPTPRGKGAEFAQIHSKFEAEQKDQDESELLARTDTGQVAAASILINGPLEDGGPLAQTLTVAGDTAPSSQSAQAVPADAVLETPAGTLEEMAPEKMGALDAPVAAKLTPSAPKLGQTDTSSHPQESVDSPPKADIAALPGNVDPALQSTLVSATSPVAAIATPTIKNTGKLEAVASASAASPASAPTGDGAPTKGDKPVRTIAPSDFPAGDGDPIESTTQARNPHTVADTATGAKAVNPLDMAVSTQSGLPQSPTTQASAAPIPVAMTPTHSLLSATPAQVVEIISDSIAAPEDRKDRVHIQLNPPELGRVSIDFKFDANGLQHVTVTGETPEALRQLRAMHFELVNALERQGLSSQNMSFQQNQAQQDSGQQAPRSGRTDGDVVAEPDLVATSMAAARNSQSRSAAAGSLNIKL